MTEQRASSNETERGRREILVVRAGERLFGVFAEAASCVERGKTPTPLPHAPAAVLGIVSVRGRILTLLDPLALVGERRDANVTTIHATPAFLLALRGDEQLALAVDSREQLREIRLDQIETSTQAGVVLGTFQDEGATVFVLDVMRLFAAAVEGMEQRRRKRVLQDVK